MNAHSLNLHSRDHIADRKCRAPRARSGAFTLLELLVVVSIIALLVSLMLACIQTVRQAARSASCLSSLRQMGMSIFTYAIDENGRMPVYKTGTLAMHLAGDGRGKGYFPLQVAAHYLVDARGGAANNDIRNVLICPADKRTNSTPGAAAYGGYAALGGLWCAGADKYVGDLVWINSSYCYGGMFSRDLYCYDSVPVHQNSVKPSSAMFWDSPRLECDSKAIAPEMMGINLHRNGVNMALADGSARFYSFAPSNSGFIWQFCGWNGLNAIWNWWGEQRHMLGANAGCPWFDKYGQGEPWN